MPTATVTSKGQVTIPVEVRERLGIEADTRVQFVPLSDGTWQFVAAGGSGTSIRGMFSTRTAVSLNEMDDAVANAAINRFTGQ